MIISVEISLYPLNENYKSIVIDFLGKISQYKKVKVETNGMSTQLFGEYADVMELLNKEILPVFEKHKAIFILKMGKGELRYDPK